MSLDSNITQFDTLCPNRTIGPSGKENSVARKRYQHGRVFLKGKKKEKPKDPDPIDFTVEMGDANGKVAAFPLSRFGALQRPLKVRMTKLAKIGGRCFEFGRKVRNVEVVGFDK